MIIRHLFTRIILLAALAGTLTIPLSCHKDDAPLTRQEELETNYKKWQAQKAGDYTITESRNCFCADAGRFNLAVKDGALTSVTKMDGTPVSAAAYFYTIDQLFDFAREMLKKNPSKATLIYDPLRGFPISVYFDMKETTADDEIGYSVENFVKK